MYDYKVFHSTLAKPEQAPKNKVKYSNIFEPLSFLLLFFFGLLKHYSPHNKQFKDQPNKDEEEYSLRWECNIWCTSTDEITALNPHIRVDYICTSNAKSKRESKCDNNWLSVSFAIGIFALAAVTDECHGCNDEDTELNGRHDKWKLTYTIAWYIIVFMWITTDWIAIVVR